MDALAGEIMFWRVCLFSLGREALASLGVVCIIRFMKRPFSVVFFAATTLLVPALLQAAPPVTTPPKSPAVAEAMRQCIAKHEIAGAVTFVGASNRVVDFEAFGYSNMESKTPMRMDSIFWIASMTKPITATAVLMLQDEGKLSIEDPIGKYIPELANLKTADGIVRQVTIRQLLTHTSGMAEATREEGLNAKTLADLVPCHASKPLQFVPGTEWRYCQSGMNTLGRIVEVVSGDSYPKFLQKRILGPLGMKDTTFYPTKSQLRRLATSYCLENGTLYPTNIAYLTDRTLSAKDRYPAAHAGLFTTASDYARFAQMLLNEGSVGKKQFLRPGTVLMMTSLQTGELKAGFTGGLGWGLGVGVVEKPQGVTDMLSSGSFGHGGMYGTQAWIDPIKGAVYLLFIQRSNLPNSDDSVVRKAFQNAAGAEIAGSAK